MTETITLKGLSWGHRRASGPLPDLSRAFAARHPGLSVHWADRTLAGFEHQAIAETARDFDLVIFDHPFLGDVVEAGAFLRLDIRIPERLGPEADPLYIGASLESYRYGGAVWGAPIDAATEHAILRADLLAGAGEAVPERWSEVAALGPRLRARGLFLGCPVVTPHAALFVAALMANAGRPWPTDPASAFAIDREGLAEALEALRELLECCPPEALRWNSIDLHAAMVARDDVAYAPCVYGYATYGEADMRRRLGFADFPGRVAPYPAGTAIGGTALGVSASSRHPEAAIAFVRFALSVEAQRAIIPAHHGQPALAAAWRDPEVDARFNGFFSGVRASMTSAWIRPRRPGYIRFQHEAGRSIEALARREASVPATVDAVLALAARVGVR